MTDVLTVIAIAVIALAIVALGWWLLIASEGVYLGRRVVIWLYDVYAGRYDDIKQYRRDIEHQFLAQPILDEFAPRTDPLVLDVATGTGRLPLALVRHARFNGRVIAADLSREMLIRAADKLDDASNVAFALAAAEHLPFPDATFELVTCLEAIEFMARREPVLEELMRVLRPGGLLLLTNRINTRLMPGKTYSEDALVEALSEYDTESIYIEHWQVDYDLVWVRKSA
ncbi:MAG: class I SAM-dependent methyltransferase [Chloroflexota bacterium]|nr:class I SAM-dependent methyltransferase [Chloroflexota bacterium]